MSYILKKFVQLGYYLLNIVKVTSLGKIYDVNKLSIVNNIKERDPNIELPLVAVHGIFGFGEDSGLGINYFTGLVSLLKKYPNIKFYAPSVDPVGGWRIRCMDLIIQTKYFYPQWGKTSPVHFLGHSLGSITILKCIDFLSKPCYICNYDIAKVMKIHKKKFDTKTLERLAILGLNRYASSFDFLNIVLASDFGPEMIKTITTLSGPLSGLIDFGLKANEDTLDFHGFNTTYTNYVLFKLFVKYAPDFIKNLYVIKIEPEEVDIYNLYDCFNSSSVLLTNRYGVWELSTLGCDTIFKDTEINKNIYYNLIGFEAINRAVPYFYQLRVSPLFYITNIYQKYINAGVISSDGAVELTSQISFKNQPRILSNMIPFKPGVMYYSIENGDHLDIIIIESKVFSEEFFTCVLTFMKKNEILTLRKRKSDIFSRNELQDHPGTQK